MGTPIHAFEFVPPRCPACRGRRTRQLKGINPVDRDRAPGLPHALRPVPAGMWIRHRHASLQNARRIVIDEPAPQCPRYYLRPRANKGTRRGTSRYFALWTPFDRARREDLGLPAYRGKKAVRRWLGGLVRAKPRRIQHRAGKLTQPRSESITESFVHTPDYAGRSVADRADRRVALLAAVHLDGEPSAAAKEICPAARSGHERGRDMPRRRA